MSIVTLADKPWSFLVNMAWTYKVPLLMTYAAKPGDSPTTEVVQLKTLLTQAYYQEKDKKARKKEEAFVPAVSAERVEIQLTEPWSAESRTTWSMDLPESLQDQPLDLLKKRLQVSRHAKLLIYAQGSGAQVGPTDSWSLVRVFRAGEPHLILRVVREANAKRPRPQEYKVTWAPTEEEKSEMAKSPGSMTQRQQIEQEIEKITNREIPRLFQQFREEALRTSDKYAWVEQTDKAIRAIEAFLGGVKEDMLIQILLHRPVKPAGLTELMWRVHKTKLTNAATAVAGTQDAASFVFRTGQEVIRPNQIERLGGGSLVSAAETDPGLRQWLQDRAPLEGQKSAPAVEWLGGLLSTMKGSDEEQILKLLSFVGVPFMLWRNIAHRPDLVQMLEDAGWKSGETAPGFLTSFFWQGGTVQVGEQVKLPSSYRAQSSLTKDDLLTMLRDPGIMQELPRLLGFPLTALVQIPPQDSNNTQDKTDTYILRNIISAMPHDLVLDDKGIPKLDSRGFKIREPLPRGMQYFNDSKAKNDRADRMSKILSAVESSYTPPILAKLSGLEDRVRLLRLELGKVYRKTETLEEEAATQARRARESAQGGPAAAYYERGKEVSIPKDQTSDLLSRQVMAIDVVRADGTGQRVTMDNRSLSFAPYEAAETLRVFTADPEAVKALVVFRALGIYATVPGGRDILPVVMLDEKEAAKSRVPAGMGKLGDDEVFFFLYGAHDAVSTQLLREAMEENPDRTLEFEFFRRRERDSASLALAAAFPALVKLLRALTQGRAPAPIEQAEVSEFSVVIREQRLSGKSEQTRKTRLETAVLRNLVPDIAPVLTAGVEILKKYNELSRKKWVNDYLRYLDFAQFSRQNAALESELARHQNDLRQLGLWTKSYTPTQHKHLPWLYYLGPLTLDAIASIITLHPTPGLPARGRPVKRLAVPPDELADLEADVLPAFVSNATALMGEDAGPELAQMAFTLLYNQYPTGRASAPGYVRDLIENPGEEVLTGIEIATGKLSSFRAAPTIETLKDIDNQTQGLSNFVAPVIEHVQKTVIRDLSSVYHPIVWQYDREVTGTPSVGRYSFLPPGVEPTGAAVRPQTSKGTFSGLPLGTKGTFESHLLYFHHVTGMTPHPTTVLSHVMRGPAEYSTQEEAREMLEFILADLRTKARAGNVGPDSGEAPTWLGSLRHDKQLQRLIQLSGTIWGYDFKKKEETDQTFYDRMVDRWREMESIEGATGLLMEIYPWLFDEGAETRPNNNYLEFIQFFVLTFGKYTSVLRAVQDMLSPEGFRLEVVSGWGPTQELLLKKPHFFIQAPRSYTTKAQSEATKSAREYATQAAGSAASLAIMTGGQVMRGAALQATRTGGMRAAGAGGVGGEFVPEVRGSSYIPFPRRYMMHFDRFDENYKMLGSTLKRLSKEMQTDLARRWAARAVKFMQEGSSQERLPWNEIKAIYGHSVGWGGGSILDLIAGHMNKKVDSLTEADLRTYARGASVPEEEQKQIAPALRLSRPTSKLLSR